MAEIDITAKVADEAMTLLRPLLKALHEQVFAGPGGERLSPKEARERLQNMTPEERVQLANSIGVDEFLRQFQEIDNNGARTNS